MGLHFSRKEHEERVARARSLLRERKLAALLIFAQESLLYLTGYDSTGCLFFQAALLTADEEPIVLLTRRPDLQQAKETSTITDVRIWYNMVDADPARDLRDIMEEYGLKGERIGVKLDTYSLTGASWESVRRAMGRWFQFEDASDIVRHLRVVKSLAEIAYVCEAGRLADRALEAMVGATRPGGLDTEITAAGLRKILKGGGDTPPAGPLVNSGKRALYGRNVCGDHKIEPQDQVTIEFATTYRRYNACIMRTAIVGEAGVTHRGLFTLVRNALQAMTEAATPDRPLGEIDDAHRRIFDAAEHQVDRFAACGRFLGATYRPNWVDVPPRPYSGNPIPAEPGMVMFVHAMFADARMGLAMSAGHTILITEEGREVISSPPLDLPVV